MVWKWPAAPSKVIFVVDPEIRHLTGRWTAQNSMWEFFLNIPLNNFHTLHDSKFFVCNNWFSVLSKLKRFTKWLALMTKCFVEKFYLRHLKNLVNSVTSPEPTMSQAWTPTSTSASGTPPLVLPSAWLTQEVLAFRTRTWSTRRRSWSGTSTIWLLHT